MCNGDKREFGQWSFSVLDPWNNVEVVSNRVQLEDEKVRVYFLRHGYFNPYNPILDTVDFNDRLFPLVFKDGEFVVDKSVDPWVADGHDLPELTGEGKNSEYKVGQTTLRDGYFYIFDNDDPDYYYEFMVRNGQFLPIYWDDDNREKGAVKNVLDRRLKTERERIGWLLDSGRNMSAAYSTVQWSHAYHQKVLNNDKASKDDQEGLRDKRCFAFRTDHYVKSETSNNITGRTQNLESLKILSNGSFVNQSGVFAYLDPTPSNGVQQLFGNLADLEYQNQLTADTEGKNDIFVTLFDPMGALFDLVDFFSDCMEYFVCYVQGIQTGVDPKSVYAKQLNRPQFLGAISGNDWSPEEKGISEMFTFAAQLIKFLELNIPKKDKYKDAVNTDMLNKILDVEGRKQLRDVICDIKHAFKTLFDEIGNYDEAQSALIDYLHPDANVFAKLQGKNYVLKILSVLSTNIADIDGVYDTVETYNVEQKRQEEYNQLVQNFIAGEGDYANNPFRKMLFEQINFGNAQKMPSDEKDHYNLFNVQAVQVMNTCAGSPQLVDPCFDMLNSVLIEGCGAFVKNEYKEYDQDGKLVAKKVEIIPLVSPDMLDMEFIEATGNNDGTGVTHTGFEPQSKHPKQQAINGAFMFLDKGKGAGDMLSDSQESIDARGARVTEISKLEDLIADTADPELRAQHQNQLDDLNRPQKWYQDKYWFKFFKEGSPVQKVMDSKTVKGMGLGLAVFNMRNAKLDNERDFVELAGNSLSVVDASIQLGAKFSGKVAEASGKMLFKHLGPIAGGIGGAVNVIDGVQLAM